jgi:DNA repair exonuclease SbcCD ATPase subunit
MFDSDVKGLHNLVNQIDAYLGSDKPQELVQISSKVAEILDRIEARKGELLQLEPTLETVKRAVDDQDRHKKLLKQNIDIIEAGERMNALEEEIEELEAKRTQIEGHSTVYKDYTTAKECKEELQQKKANYDGRFASHVEQIRSLKVSMSFAAGA